MEFVKALKALITIITLFAPAINALATALFPSDASKLKDLQNEILANELKDSEDIASVLIPDAADVLAGLRDGKY